MIIAFDYHTYVNMIKDERILLSKNCKFLLEARFALSSSSSNIEYERIGILSQ